MEIEHIAFNVAEPRKITDWYVKNLGFKVNRQDEEAPFTTFIADNRGVMVEFYNNPADQVPDYKNMNPLILHLAFKTDAPGEDKQKLVDAGAEVVNDEKLQNGSRIIMLRDPWGLAIQLCKRN